MNTSETRSQQGLSPAQRFFKRTFDVVVSGLGLGLTWWLILLAWVAATIDTGSNGIFVQRRVGLYGRSFALFKIRTMRDQLDIDTLVTTSDDLRVTRLGWFLRRAKLDELPQLVNVLFGHMSVVGPRPDVAGFADQLSGPDRIILSVRPGITGPATLRFRDEEALLGQQQDPERYNREVIFPEKVRLNRHYIESYAFRKDLEYILRTLTG